MRLFIGNKAYSSWSMRGWLAVKHSGLPFDEATVPLYDEAWNSRREGDEFAPSGGKVPILWDEGDVVVWDSLAIIDYLNEKTGGARGYWPIDPAARAMARSMAAEMHSSFAALRRSHSMNIRAQFPPQPLSPAVEADVVRILQNLGGGPREIWRIRRISVRRMGRGGHHVRARRHALHHLRHPRRALCPALYASRHQPPPCAGMDRRRTGRRLGDRPSSKGQCRGSGGQRRRHSRRHTPARQISRGLTPAWQTIVPRPAIKLPTAAAPDGCDARFLPSHAPVPRPASHQDELELRQRY